MAINLIPLTTEEMREIQSSVVDKMLELNKEMRQGNCPNAAQTISSLSKLSTKISHYERKDR